MAMYAIYNKHIYIKLKTKRKIVSQAANTVITVPPQVVITTTHGVASDGKGGQTDDP